MTAAYDIFIEEYNMTGSEKAYGYSAGTLTALRAQEIGFFKQVLRTENGVSTACRAGWFLRDAGRAHP